MSAIETFDVIVLGSGGAGCAAALAASSLGLTVALVEKDQLLGGGTADSLGTFWIANNSMAQAQSLADDFESALTYAKFVAGG